MTPLAGLCSMATRGLLRDLGANLTGSLSVRFQAAGGVDVVHEIRAGSRADLAVLSEDQMAELERDGLLVAGTLRPLYVSEVVAAVPEEAPPVALTTEVDLREALLAARRVAHSTGPSGEALLALLGRWGLEESLRPRLVRAAPGHPVGSLLAGGEADLGFQQRSELSDHDGVRVLGPLPGEAAIRSTFSGAVLARSANTKTALQVLEALAGTDVEDLVVAAGMAIAPAEQEAHSKRTERSPSTNRLDA